jgi:FkbM family methyltransferase
MSPLFWALPLAVLTFACGFLSGVDFSRPHATIRTIQHLPSQLVFSSSLYSLVPVHVANVSTQGHLDLGENVTAVVVDIGLEHWGFFAPYARENASVAVLGVEALPRNFFNVRARTHEWARAHGVDRRRVPVLNFAIGPNTSMVEFRTSWVPACGSILPTADTNKFWCAETVDRIHVPMVTLEWLLRLVPPHAQLPHLKIDVEGADLVVARSAGSQLSRFDGVTIECQNVHPRAPGQHRVGGCTVLEATAFFRSAGFRGGGCELDDGQLGNCHFGKTAESARAARDFFTHWEHAGYVDVKLPPPDAGC